MSNALAKIIARDQRRCAPVPWIYHRYPWFTAQIHTLIFLLFTICTCRLLPNKGPRNDLASRFSETRPVLQKSFRLICLLVPTTWLVRAMVWPSIFGAVSRSASLAPLTGKAAF